MTHRRRGGFRRFKSHKRPGITAWRMLKGALIFGPPAAYAYESYSGASGTMGQKIVNGGLSGIIQAYTGYNINNKQFYPATLIVGWGGPAVVKIASSLKLGRLFRV